MGSGFFRSTAESNRRNVSQSGKNRPQLCRRLGCEVLEDRTMLSIGGGSIEASTDNDSNDQISEAWTLTAGTAQAGTIDPATDVDMFQFTVTTGQTASIDVDNASGSSLDSWMRLFDNYGNQLDASDDDAGPAPENSSRESYLEYTFDTGGTYYVGISGYQNSGYDPITGTDDSSGSTGAYDITITLSHTYMIFDEWGGTWHDAEEDHYGDEYLCWAGTASNTLAWTGWGNIPGMGGGDADIIFDYYEDHWQDDTGRPRYAWSWWADGVDRTVNWDDWAHVDVPGGGFYPDVDWNSYMYYAAYANSGGSTESMPTVAQYLQSGLATGILLKGPTSNHWITCWGFDYDPDSPDYYQAIWVTDSDDDQVKLERYPVANDGSRWYLSGGRYNGRSIVYIDGLARNNIGSSDEIGVHRPVGNAGYFIQDPNGNGYWDAGDRFFEFGYGTDTPIVGDWNGDGLDEIGVHRAVGNAGYFIQDYNGNGYWDGGDRYFQFGYGSDTPIIGDWNGDGYDEIGVHRPVGNAGYFIQDYNGNGYWDGGDRYFDFGYGSDTPIIGDWNGSIGDEIGVHRGVGNAGYFIQDYNGNGYWDGSDRYHVFGYASDLPIVGDWNGNGTDQIGVHREVGNAGYFIEEYNGNGYWDAEDRFFEFGYYDDIPIIGNWASASPLMAAEGEIVPNGNLATLTISDLAPIVEEAFASFKAIGLDAKRHDVEYVITDLPGAMLGLAEHSTIYLDYNAAGHGWFVDLTPAVDEEFERIGSRKSLYALDPVASDTIDLLTVVSHELGHVLGLEDLAPEADSLMSSTLEKGLRRRLGETEWDAVLAGYWEYE